MKYWLLDWEVERYRSFSTPWTPEQRERWFYWRERFRKGGRFVEEWEPPYLRLFRGEWGEEEKEEVKPVPDFTHGYIDLACSQRAKEIIAPLVRDYVEFLPLDTEVGPYWELNLPRLSCLDETRAEVKRFRDSGRIMEILRYACKWERIGHHHLFRLAEHWGSRFASDAFRQLVEAHGLTGLIFQEIPLVEGERPPWED